MNHNSLITALTNELSNLNPPKFRIINQSPAYQDYDYMSLKNAIKVPHNLYNICDSTGVIMKHVLEVVYTPFTKADIKIELLGNILTVTIGNENLKHKYKDFVVYNKISYQSNKFSIKLSDAIDTSNILAAANEGILTIEIPYLVETYTDKEPVLINIL